jgi:3-oxoacyl-[acyl-carrier-protein] synthase III
LRGFEFGTDGSGADTLIVNDGGARCVEQSIKPRHRKRWSSRLYMDGPSLMSFTIGAIPQLVREIVGKANLSLAEIEHFLMHQATRKMLEQLQAALQVDDNKLPIRLSHRGNTVSSTLPILINDMRADGQISNGSQNVLVGFGVGWSWAGCLWRA